MFNKLIALILLCLTTTQLSIAAENEGVPGEAEALQIQFQMGAAWAFQLVNGAQPDPEEVAVLKQFSRLIPFGATDQGSGVRKERTLFRIEVSPDRIILLGAQKDNLQLLIGAPVSPEVMAAAHRNSVYLFAEGTEGKEKFLDLLGLVVKVDDKMKSEFGVSAFADRNTQEPFNRQVMQIGERVALFLDLNPKLTEAQLTAFVVAINQSACEKLLSIFKP